MPDQVLIAASHHDARRWQRQHPDRWNRVVPVSHPWGMLGVPVDRVDITPMADGHRDLLEALEIARRRLLTTTGTDEAIHYLPR